LQWTWGLVLNRENVENVRGSQREVASSLQIRIGVWDYKKEDIEKKIRYHQKMLKPLDYHSILPANLIKQVIIWPDGLSLLSKLRHLLSKFIQKSLVSMIPWFKFRYNQLDQSDKRGPNDKLPVGLVLARPIS
jgi:hypothetical protein